MQVQVTYYGGQLGGYLDRSGDQLGLLHPLLVLRGELALLCLVRHLVYAHLQRRRPARDDELVELLDDGMPLQRVRLLPQGCGWAQHLELKYSIW